jgi:hypothetical protein
MVGERRTTRDREVAVHPTHEKIPILCMPPHISCDLFYYFFLARGLSCSTKLVTLFEAIAAHSGSVMTFIFFN